jgi:CRISPR/Cas system CMR-associated protein Cmr1 (group 7 of RAMP superfamily)
MDAFIPLTLGLLVLLVLVMVGLARAFNGTGVDQILDWKPTRDYETEIELEQDDVSQMIEAQNEMRRRKGKEDITLADVHKAAEEDERLRMRGKGPFGGQGG